MREQLLRYRVRRLVLRKRLRRNSGPRQKVTSSRFFVAVDAAAIWEAAQRLESDSHTVQSDISRECLPFAICVICWRRLAPPSFSIPTGFRGIVISIDTCSWLHIRLN